MVIMLLVILMVFTACWLPFQIDILYTEHRSNIASEVSIISVLHTDIETNEHRASWLVEIESRGVQRMWRDAAADISVA